MDSGNRFDWVPFYEELANKLLNFEDNRKELVDDVYDIYKISGVKPPDNVKDKMCMDIDPFSFYSFFNRQKDENSRKKIVGAITEIFKISASIPTSFDGIPIFQDHPMYYDINRDGYETDIDTLWKLFDAAMKYAYKDMTFNSKKSVKEYFDQVQNIYRIANSKITGGLFWIAPKVFLNLDRPNIHYIYKSGQIPDEVVDTLPLKYKSGDQLDPLSGDTYFEIVDKIQEYLKNDDSDFNYFYELSDKANEAYKDKSEEEKENKREKGNKPIADGEAQALSEEQTETNKGSETDDIRQATGGSNILYYGVPGSGKSYTVEGEIKDEIGDDSSKVERVVFHPDYTYSDFVGQILPRRVKGEGGKDDKLEYPFVPGPFTRVLKKAIHDRGNKYYLVIEEINRGNAPAIFGDIFQLLDRKENGEGKYSITNYDIADYVYEDGEHKVQIPSNLTLYATMNTSDQNVFTLDTAFQRRWDMQLILNDINQAEHANQQIEGSEITWGVFATTINEEILSENKNMISSEDKRLGAYFVTKDELNKKQFAEKVLKYLWDDAFKMSRDEVFNINFKSLEDVISKYEETKTEDPLKVVLKEEIYKEMSPETNESDTAESDNKQNQD